MARGRFLLLLSFVLIGIVNAATVYLLQAFTAFSGGSIFFITAVASIVALVVFTYAVTKLGY